MRYLTFSLFLVFIVAAEPVLHFTLNRRGGPLTVTQDNVDYVDLAYLSQQLETTEARFKLTQRQVQGNKLVRKPKDTQLMGTVAEEGMWYARFSIGNPPQELEVDLNMLISDFYVLTTTSPKGSKYDDFFSQSMVKSLDRPYPICLQPTDVFHLPTINVSLPLSFAYCRPQKFSLRTLSASGSVLGLAPSEHLSQTHTTSLFQQLLEKEAIERPVFSLMLINGQDGVLSLGGTAALAIQMVEAQTKAELDSLGGHEQQEPMPAAEPIPPLVKRSRTKEDIAPRQPDWDDGWTWTDVQGAEGWWQILMRGVWVDSSKVLTNQAVVVDVRAHHMNTSPNANNKLNRK